MRGGHSRGILVREPSGKLPPSTTSRQWEFRPLSSCRWTSGNVGVVPVGPDSDTVIGSLWKWLLARAVFEIVLASAGVSHAKSWV